jgi:hypothetical protein
LQLSNLVAALFLAFCTRDSELFASQRGYGERDADHRERRDRN